jgi:hypothetical protein
MAHTLSLNYDIAGPARPLIPKADFIHKSIDMVEP